MNSLFSQNRKHPKLGIVRPHNGVDYTSSPDNTIVASAAGRVVIARTSTPDGYGRMVAIEHNLDGNIFTSVYAHLQTVSVKVGQVVKQGQRIGVKGDTGLSAGVHLHFEIRIGTYGLKRYVDPLPYIFDKEAQLVQTYLNKVGYIVRADGYYGNQTITAVADFQKKYGLTADGVAGRTTFARLKEEAEKVKPIKQKEKEVVMMYKPTSKAMREATERVLKHFEDEKEFPKTNLSDTHRKNFEKDELEMSAAVGLLFTILDRYLIDKE